MIYDIQLIDQTPRRLAVIDLSAEQYESLHAAEAGVLSEMCDIARTALLAGGIKLIDTVHLSLNKREVVEAAPGYTIQEAEEIERGERLDAPVSEEAKLIVAALHPCINTKVSELHDRQRV